MHMLLFWLTSSTIDCCFSVCGSVGFDPPLAISSLTGSLFGSDIVDVYYPAISRIHTWMLEANGMKCKCTLSVQGMYMLWLFSCARWVHRTPSCMADSLHVVATTCIQITFNHIKVTTWQHLCHHCWTTCKNLTVLRRRTLQSSQTESKENT